MALLLCQSLGKACSGLGHLCTFPCRLCGETCRLGCDGLCKALTSPFFPYLAATCALNLPPTVWGFLAMTKDCGDTRWIGVNAVGTLAHILGAFYIVLQIQRSDNEGSGTVIAQAVDTERGASPKTSYERVVETSEVKMGDGGKFSTVYMRSSTNNGGSLHRLGQVMCYDVGVAAYIIVFLAWVVWQSMGIGAVIGGEMGDCEDVQKWATNSLILGWVYMMIVASAFCCSMLCLRPF